MNTDRISVIIPIYNVEKYLEKCIESIIKQTYKNLEIILVDDGSTDNCPIICDDYEKKDNRIVVIHKENGGLSDARNAGLKVINSKYVTFVDSDDYVDGKYIELLYKAIKKDNTKIAQCGIVKFDDKTEQIEHIGYNENNINTYKKMILDMGNEHCIDNVVVWNKMYNIELLQNMKFPKGKLHEDEFFTYKVLFNAKKISIIKDCLYYYRQSEQSIMGKKYNLKRLDIIDAFEEKTNFFKNEKVDELYKATILQYMDLIKKNYCKVKKYYSSEKVILNGLKLKYRKVYRDMLKIKSISLKSKIRKYFFYRIPNLYYKMHYKDI